MTAGKGVRPTRLDMPCCRTLFRRSMGLDRRRSTRTGSVMVYAPWILSSMWMLFGRCWSELVDGVDWTWPLTRPGETGPMEGMHEDVEAAADVEVDAAGEDELAMSISLILILWARGSPDATASMVEGVRM